MTYQIQTPIREIIFFSIYTDLDKVRDMSNLQLSCPVSRVLRRVSYNGDWMTAHTQNGRLPKIQLHPGVICRFRRAGSDIFGGSSISARRPFQLITHATLLSPL
jgi:hypothetical protein